MRKEPRPSKDPAAILHAMDQSSSALYRPISASLCFLERVYASGLGVYLGAEGVGIRKRLQAPVPVISIGNLAVGGTGKTPAVIALSSAFQALGLNVAVLSRGHGGSASALGGVVSDDQGNILLTTAESGDEPMALALALPGVPVLIGKDRRISAARAVKQFKPDVLLLDDGFQYWQLWRDIDIVLLDANRPFDNGHCLPRGLLREPKANLGRADYVIVTRSSKLTLEQRNSVKQEILKTAPDVKVYFSQHRSMPCVPANGPAQEFENPIDTLAICAIARPQSFMETLASTGVHPVDTMFLSDHFSYQVSDALRIVGKMKACCAKTLVTTQKDFVKLGPLLPDVPIFVQPIEFEVDNKAELISDLFDRAMAIAPARTL